MTLTEKYNFKVLTDQFSNSVPEFYQDESEKQLLENFEKFTLTLKHKKPPYSMIEVGSNQAYYSLLFKHMLGKDNTINILIEPHLPYLQAGKKHFKANNCEGIFYHRGIGTNWVIQANRDIASFKAKPILLTEALHDNKLAKVDVLHFDIDGSEMLILFENRELFVKNIFKFVYILTHSTRWHDDCREFFNDLKYELLIDIPYYLKSVGEDGLLIFKSKE